MHFPLFVGILYLVFFYCALLCVLTGFAIILARKREFAALLYMSSLCLVIVRILWLFLVLPRVGLQCVIEKVYLLIILTYFLRNDCSILSRLGITNTLFARFLEGLRS